jgi:hypothetical protein
LNSILQSRFTEMVRWVKNRLDHHNDKIERFYSACAEEEELTSELLNDIDIARALAKLTQTLPNSEIIPLNHTMDIRKIFSSFTEIVHVNENNFPAFVVL